MSDRWNRERLESAVESLRHQIRDRYMSGQLSLEVGYEADRNLKLALAEVAGSTPNRAVIQSHLTAAGKPVPELATQFDEIVQALPSAEL